MPAEVSEVVDPTAEYALRLGDDALVMGQRLCEWCAKAPTLEEDIAIANVGLDYFGRARMCLKFAGTRLNKSEDDLAFLRPAEHFRNLLLVELPIGDFAFTMVRQYLLDEFELAFFAALAHSRDAFFAAVAAKTLKEVRYHRRRSAEWLRRLGLGTEESHRRSQAAVDEIWGYVPELFLMDSVEMQLESQGIAVDRYALKDDWQASVQQMFDQVGLRSPQDEWQVVGGRAGIHTESLSHMLTEMQYLQRAYPGATW